MVRFCTSPPLLLLLLSASAVAFTPSFTPSYKTNRISVSCNLKSGNGEDGIQNRRSALITTAAGIAGVASSGFLTSQFSIPSASAKLIEPTTTTKIPTWTLQNGVLPNTIVKMPILALNTVGLSVEDTTRAVGLALQKGITHVDFHPGKERDGVANFLKESSSVEGKKLFLTTKIRKPPPGTSPQDAATLCKNQINEDLSILGVTQVDMLMLRDSPDCTVMQSQWSVLEQALKDGRCRSIGVINYCQGSLECILQTCTVTPAVNYFMYHVGMGSDGSRAQKLRAFGEERGIRTFAYGAVGEPGPLDVDILKNPVLSKIGMDHDGKSTEEVALRWVLQGGAACSVRPTTEFGLGMSVCGMEGSKCKDGIGMRAGSFDWKLSDGEVVQLNRLTEPDGNPTLFSSAGCPDAYVMPKK